MCPLHTMRIEVEVAMTAGGIRDWTGMLSMDITWWKMVRSQGVDQERRLGSAMLWVEI